MWANQPLPIYIGWDSREAVASDVCAHSIRRRTNTNPEIFYLKHRELRKDGAFARPWLVDGPSGNWMDLIDNRPFSTEFSHTRFLVPSLMKYKGWALFMDSDMIFLSDVKKLFSLCNDKYAVMCVKHRHNVDKPDQIKMDGRAQLGYFRKNWSSFMLFNCSHPANKWLTPERVNFAKGGDLHAMCWLKDHEIGELPTSYNFIAGVSPKMAFHDMLPDVVHYTEGGPWFSECPDVPFAQEWIDEYEHWQANYSGQIASVPSIKYEEGI